jgi:hypothetical protein
LHIPLIIIVEKELKAALFQGQKYTNQEESISHTHIIITTTIVPKLFDTSTSSYNWNSFLWLIIIRYSSLSLPPFSPSQLKCSLLIEPSLIIQAGISVMFSFMEPMPGT